MATPFDIDKFSADKNYVIEASAGTGKTYNIVEIVNKLILGGIPLEKMLIVTYTEKAAGELKNRIREKLPSANVDEASIGTIHSFCKNSIEGFCISSGKPSKLSLIDEGEVSEFIKQYIRSESMYTEICVLFAKEKEIEEKITKKINAVINLYYLDKDYKPVDTIAKLNTEIGNSKLDGIQGYRELVINKRKPQEVFPEIQKALDVLEKSKDAKLRELFDAVNNSEKLEFSGRQIQKRWVKSTNPIELDAFDVIVNGSKAVAKIFKATVDFCVLSHIDDIYQKWQERKEKNSQQTFNDMLRSVREEIVNNGPLLECLKKKYTYAIIDEFQDTNQKQWDIFRNVFLDGEHHITVVGDPKQSIYSFQGADINVYKKATQEIISRGGIECSLSCNYRATQDIVDSANNFFANNTAIDGFTPSTCGKKELKAEYDGMHTDAFWIVHGEDKNPTNCLSYACAVCQTIVDCCSYVGDKTKLRVSDENGKFRNVSFKDFTILSKTWNGMKPYTEALEISGIPYVMYKDTSLFSGKESSYWIALLEAIDVSDYTGRNRSKFKKALHTVFFDFNLNELNDSRLDKDNIEEITLFEKWGSLAMEKRWEDMIDSIIADTELEERMSSLNHLKSLGLMRQLGDYCIEYLDAGNTISELVNNLKKKKKNRNDEDEDEVDNIVAKATDYDCVKIMTIHASKGLEFPVVISVAGDTGPRIYDEVYTYHDKNDNFVLDFDKDAKGKNREEQAQEWKRLFYVDYTRAKYILMMPYYSPLNEPFEFISASVADYITAGYAYRQLPDKTPIYDKGIDGLSLEVKKILSKTSLPADIVTESEQKELLKKIIKGEFFHLSYKHAYSSLSHSKAEPETITDEGISKDNGETTADNGLAKFDPNPKVIDCNYDALVDPIVLSENFPAGAGLGNALHEIFEIIDYKQGTDTKNIDELTEERYRKNGLRFKPEWLSDTKRIIDNVLSAKLPGIHGSSSTGSDISLKNIETVDRLNEVEFNFNKEDQKLHHYFNGFIDLIFRQGEYYSILDWKSDRLNDEFTSYSDKDSLKKHVDELYAIQRVLYSYTLIKWLKNFYKDLTEQEIFERHFGGIYYVFLRGCNAETGNGIYAQTWENYKDLEDAYNIIIKEKVRG